MENSILEHGGEVFGETANRDLTTEPEQHIDRLFDDQLEEEIIALKRHIDAANARLLTLVAELDRREIPQTIHQLSTTMWLRHFCRMTGTEASRTTKTARALTRMPDVARQAATGTIPPASVRILATARDKHPDEFPIHEAVFAEAATYLDTAELRRTISYWEQQVDDSRSTPQQRADALTDLCRFWLDHNDDLSSNGGERPHVTVTVPYATLTGEERRLGEIDGTAVDPETIRRLACDAGIVRIVTDGESQPLDVGRRVRTVPPAIRRALERRDGGCARPGCSAPVSWCDAHHVLHWADGGPTSLPNLVLLCRRHHTATHDGKQPGDP